MKLSIWQQFSSNHSSYFAIIGRFDNVDIAKTKTTILRDWIYRMLWEQDNKTAKDEIYEKYRIKWYENGMSWNGHPDSVDKVVQRFNSDVFLLTSETWDTPKPLIELVQKMNPNQVHLYSAGEDWYFIKINLTALAPDEKTAQNFCQYLQSIDGKTGIGRSSVVWAKDKMTYIPQGIYAKATEKFTKIEMTFVKAEDLILLLEYMKENNWSDIKYQFIQEDAT